MTFLHADDWKPAMIQVGYPRKIIGFHLRLDPEITPFKSGNSGYCGDWCTSREVCLSVDPLVWPMIGEDEELYGRVNMLGLISRGHDMNEVLFAHTEPKIIAAFDAPAAYVTACGDEFGIQEIDTDKIEGFVFQGYDVMGYFGHFSMLYSFDMGMDQAHALLEESGATLNSTGLITEETAAIRMASMGSLPDRQYGNHAPFVPVGVWTRKSKGTDFLFKCEP